MEEQSKETCCWCRVLEVQFLYSTYSPTGTSVGLAFHTPARCHHRDIYQRLVLNPQRQRRPCSSNRVNSIHCPGS